MGARALYLVPRQVPPTKATKDFEVMILHAHSGGFRPLYTPHMTPKP